MTSHTPRHAIRYGSMELYGVRYRIDLDLFRQAMAERTMDGAGDGIGDLAKEAGVSHMTPRRLLKGLPIAAKSLRSLLGVLGLRFQDIAIPEDAATPPN